MGRPQRRKGNFSQNKKFHKFRKTRNFKRDMDQIFEDQKPENSEKLLNQPINELLPGFGQFYCITCSRYFVNKHALEVHNGTKQHKRRTKILKDKPYDHKEAEECAKY